MIMKESFENWTAYDTWLVENYTSYAIYKIDEVDGKINIEYCPKDEFSATLGKL